MRRSSVNDFRSTVRRLREFENATYARKTFDHRLLREDSMCEVVTTEAARVVEMTDPAWDAQSDEL